MNRRQTLLTLLVLGSTPRAGLAQQAGKVHRVGFLSGGGAPPDGALPASLRQALRDLGYIEGKNVAYTGRWADAKLARLPELAAELVNLKVDAIVTGGGPATHAAKKATATIPIVMAGPAGDAVATGLVASLARPGGNITGMSDEASQLSAKRMEILKLAVPKAARIAILWNADDQAMTLRYNAIEHAAQILHVTVQPLGVREPNDFETAFAAMTRERPDALFLVADALTSLNRKRVMEFAELHRIPAMYEFGFIVQGGGLMSYGPNLDDSFRAVARFLDRIFKGARPSDLPVEQPTRYYLHINMKTARALGLNIPSTLLASADQVID
jgi:putative tryptophan/tyrosine transport system substrate-binding protein